MTRPPHAKTPVVCIVRPSEDYSQTFIDAHIERLPSRNVTVCCERFPTSFNGHRSWQNRLAFSAWRASRATGFFVEMADRWGTASMARFLRRRKVGVVLAEFGPTAVRVLPACRSAGVPLVAHFHGFDCYRHALVESYRRAYDRLFQEAAGIVAVSRSMADCLRELGAPREKIFVNPCGVDTQVFSGSEPDRQPPHFLSVGRFVDKKAPHLTLLAFSRAHARNPDLRLRMVGNGPLLGACQEMAQALGLEGVVTFTGPVAHDRIAELMRQSRGFLQHSVRAPDGDAEGTPVAVLEAMAAGIPVVATRHTGIADAIEHDRTGLLVEEFDCDAMGAAIERLAREPGLAARLGHAARAKAVEDLSMKHSIRRLHGFLEQINGSSRPGTEPVSLPGSVRPASETSSKASAAGLAARANR